jgi:phosphatidylglycerophosphate synthase
LDGTLARFRHIERPKYGFFIDHTTDAFSQIFVFFGLGVSPYIRFDVAAVALVGYLLLSVLVCVRTYVTGVFKLSYIGLGPTELRLIIILANTVVYSVGNPGWRFALGDFSVYDMLIIALTILIFGVFIFSALRQARLIERMEKAGEL